MLYFSPKGSEIMQPTQTIESIESIADIQTLVRRGFTEWSAYGDVSVRANADNTLLIFNYSTIAQYKGRWNYFERVARGLIIARPTGEIVARPFDKFFNWFEHGRRTDGHIVTVMEKLDGSLGILYRTPDGYKIATRGSFESDQAQWATQFLNAYFDLSDLPDEITLLFEIIYPDNRIVVDYEDREDLVLIAARNRFTGEFLPFFPNMYDLAQQYGFTLPMVYQFNNIGEIIAATDHLDMTHEGWVVEFSDGNRFKFKGDRYVEMQRLLSDLTFKNVLEAIQDDLLDELIARIPDEFLSHVRHWEAHIRGRIASIQHAVNAAYALAPKTDRKTFALWVQANHPKLASYLFARFDKKPIEPFIFRNEDFGDIPADGADSDQI